MSGVTARGGVGRDNGSVGGWDWGEVSFSGGGSWKGVSGFKFRGFTFQGFGFRVSRFHVSVSEFQVSGFGIGTERLEVWRSFGMGLRILGWWGGWRSWWIGFLRRRRTGMESARSARERAARMGLRGMTMGL